MEGTACGRKGVLNALGSESYGVRSLYLPPWRVKPKAGDGTGFEYRRGVKALESSTLSLSAMKKPRHDPGKQQNQYGGDGGLSEF